MNARSNLRLAATRSFHARTTLLATRTTRIVFTAKRALLAASATLHHAKTHRSTNRHAPTRLYPRIAVARRFASSAPSFFSATTLYHA